MRKLTLLTASALVCSIATAEPTVPLIPVVPAAKVKANLPERPAPAPAPAAVKAQPVALPMQAAVVSQNTGAKGRTEVAMQPGVNSIIQVAQGHLNRIVTPYSSPKVTTSSQATTEIRDNVIYAGTNSDAPLTMFITDAGSEDQALSLTLIPRKIPPREVFLKLDGAGDLGTHVSRRAEKWEESQPYVATIESLFRTLALGDVPPGYRLSQEAQGRLPACRQTGLSFDFTSGQTVSGHNLIVHIGVAENTSPRTVEFVENTCGDWNVASVSAFPLNVLAPGERTEVYVAVKRNYVEEVQVNRPSLLSGGY